MRGLLEFVITTRPAAVGSSYSTNRAPPCRLSLQDRREMPLNQMKSKQMNRHSSWTLKVVTGQRVCAWRIAAHLDAVITALQYLEKYL